MLNTLHFNEFNINGFEVDTSVDFGRVNLMTGMNSMGKTLMLEVVWFFNHIVQAYTTILYTDGDKADSEIKKYISEVAEYLFDTTDLNGGFVFESDKCNLNLMFKNGKSTFVDFEIIDPSKFSIDSLSKNMYVSDTAKNLKHYERYLRKLKEHKIEFVSGIIEIRLLKDDFTLPDITFFTEFKYTLDKIRQQGNRFELDSIKSTYGNKSIGLGNDEFLYIKRSIPYLSNGTDIKKISALSSGTVNLLLTHYFWVPNPEIYNYIKG